MVLENFLLLKGIYEINLKVCSKLKFPLVLANHRQDLS